MRAALAQQGARILESFAGQAAPEAARFLIRRGFRETLRTWEIRLDLGRFDPSPFAHYLERSRREGITIVTLEDELRRYPGVMRRAYDVHNTVVADIPMPIPYTPVQLEVYVRSPIESPWSLPYACFRAVAGDDYVGEASLRRSAHGTHLYHGVTGVLPAYRGKGVAMVLKLATINERLGFTRQPAWTTLEAALEPGQAP